MHRVTKRLLVWAVLFAAVLSMGAPYVYVAYLAAPAEELRMASVPSFEVADVPLDGTWRIAAGSAAGYRVDEVVFGRASTAVGRTDRVSGQITVAGTAVTSGAVKVDLATITSNELHRDQHFRDRIMDVTQHPFATFTLSEPVDLGTVPALDQRVQVKANGQLHLHGVTRPVTVYLAVRRTAATIGIGATIPVVLADYGIGNPSFPGVTTKDHGVIEIMLTLRSSPV